MVSGEERRATNVKTSQETQEAGFRSHKRGGDCLWKRRKINDWSELSLAPVTSESNRA
jgi:hypothetical protein